MVKVYYNTQLTVIPLKQLLEEGTEKLFAKVSANEIEHKYNKDYSNFRIYYNCMEMKGEDDLKKLTDDDAVQIFVLPGKKQTEEEKQQSADKGKALGIAFRKVAAKNNQGLDLIFNEPTHMTKLLKKNPKLIHDSQLIPILRSWPLFKAYIIKDAYKDDPARNQFKSNPDYLPFIKKFIPALAKRFGVQITEGQGVENVVARPVEPTLSITQRQLQDALAGINAQGPNPGLPLVPTAAPESQPSTSNASTSAASSTDPSSSNTNPVARQDFSEQAATLRSFGFVDDEMIQLALEQTAGDVTEAVDFLIAHTSMI